MPKELTPTFTVISKACDGDETAISKILEFYDPYMNPNTLQYLMGHANITMTLGYYTHGTFQSAKAELERLAC